MLQADEGYYFGIGAFETIAIEHGKIIFYEEHWNRLKKTLDYFNLSISEKEVEAKLKEVWKQQDLSDGRKVLKIAVSEKNILITTRENPYREEEYANGFTTAFSQVRRNETSDLTYHKTLNYGDCILEKRKAKALGIDEPIFLNSRGEICEGAVTNVFFVKNRMLYTPPIRCGLLPGIMRAYIAKHYEVTEKVIRPEEIQNYEEMFLTNSLLGVISVRNLGNHEFTSCEIANQIREKYVAFCSEQ